jgi:uncharacterized protein YeaO (DUF488 family)
MSHSVQLQRAYDSHESGSNRGYRVWVDRLWPRGVSKEQLKIDDWLKDCAPSNELRRWFGHSVDRWDEFVKRYRSELAAGDGEAVDHLVELAKKGPLTLIYGAKDEAHNNAVVLRDLIEEKL